ncbi:MAG: pantoate--beta-alanine ligase [Dehalococcoidales bacterium]|nr:pantoate--beta-alanine ligase [Dehalococcoidales bacterium]
MKVVKTIAAMKKARQSFLGKDTGTVGFVPTMGYLHEGHLELVRHAKSENNRTVVSIFVNPAQFSPGEDLASYPRDIPRDLEMLEKIGPDIVFIPSPQGMYPPRFSTWVNVEKVTERLEGAVRPGHFRGVATVCAKLFNIVQPTIAYFGQKDAQQVVVIKKMVADLNLDIEIEVVPTVREPDGLAMSSRNIYLKPDERRAAIVIYRALKLCQKLWSQGEKDAHLVRRSMIDLVEQEPLAEVIDYISIADAETLEELHEIKPPALVSLAVKIGKPRLIDNIVLK